MPEQIMGKVIGVVAFLVFASSAVAHVATFFPAIHVSIGMVGPLHFATMAVFAAMIFSVAALHKRQPKRTVNGLFANWRLANQQNKEFQSKLVALVPFPLRVACAGTFIYAFISFLLTGLLMGPGIPSVKNGNYFLDSHGKKVRDITGLEYHRFRAFEVRFFSGGLILSIIPAVYFLTVHPRLLAETKLDTKEGSDP